MWKYKGFTLIELLIVMAVVSILIAIIIPSYRGMQNDAWIAKAEKEVQTLQVAVESYYRNNQKYPATLADLLTAKPQIISKELSDPWKTDGNTYGYKTGRIAGFGDYYIIYSNSIDGQPAVDYANVGSASITLPANSDDIVVSNMPVTKLQQ